MDIDFLWRSRRRLAPERATVRIVALGALALTLSAACASDEPVADSGAAEGGEGQVAETPTSTAAAIDDPGEDSQEPVESEDPDLDSDGPQAVVSEELTGGDGVFLGSPSPFGSDAGYVQSESLATGTARSYVAVGELGADGEWTLEPDTSADYRTRIVVRRPSEPAEFSGTVLLEWLNVSGGVDADPDFTTLREEIIRQGHIWVGVSAQRIGVEGGPVAVGVDVEGADDAGQGLKAIDPARYGSLNHPGDAYAYDIYTQVARALRSGAPVLDDVEVSSVIAVGESQSAFALVTYVNGVQPLTGAFDGFFVHSRGGSAFPLPAPGESADIATSLGGVATVFREDGDVPIMNLQAENDVVGILGSVAARQPDSERLRLWEVAGTAHADRHLIGESTAAVLDCGVEINDAPFHIVAKAALRHLVGWVGGGEPPPSAPRLEMVEGGAAEIRRDADGIALGGVRTPPVDVPAQVLSGIPGPNPDVICLLLGSTNPMAPDRLAERFSSREAYEQEYEAAVDASIEAGFVLEEDRAALEAYARPDLIVG